MCSQTTNQRDRHMNISHNCNTGAGGGAIVQEFDSSIPLSQRLELLVGERIDYIPPVLLRKYIMYSRKYVMPWYVDFLLEFHFRNIRFMVYILFYSFTV
ncbi:unnamed protein product [Schistosoma mattheei]|uniref:Uncharacterized protein n=1 Tax=Schistosoma mattheei TaxID=31246 RepID=A0A183NPI0_9TREM|nr:unnamed protein product [Schistosoma mattheei]